MLENNLIHLYQAAIKSLYHTTIDTQSVQLQKTKEEFEGEYTFVVFPQTKLSKQKPVDTAQAIGECLIKESAVIEKFNVVQGFLNICISTPALIKEFSTQINTTHFQLPKKGKKIMVEYSSPNTNKPLHLGHIRNNFLGYAVSEILKKAGYDVIKTQIINDRGIHICKSMLAWQKWGNQSTPESEGIKGDFFVGKYYVLFEQHYKKEIKYLIENAGLTKEQAMQEAPLFKEAQAMLFKWEAQDEATMQLWTTMNNWVYKGFEVTYKKLGVDFDVLYYESNTYKIGKDIVQEGLDKGVFYQREDGSVWCDLTAHGLDEKLVLRKDGTAVYMTQDIGTAIERYRNYQIDGMIYTVGNEQDYHFKVLFLIIQKLGYAFHEGLFHLSYGMVELPTGRMKTREGTVVDADDLIDEMIATAAQANEEKGKLQGLSSTAIEQINTYVGLAALKYFILKVDPKKGMIFNPEESIDFNGNTGPFILFNYVRTRSLIKKSEITLKELNEEEITQLNLTPQEKKLIQLMLAYPKQLELAAQQYSPAIIANYAYDLAKNYSQFYAATNILNESNPALKQFRLNLSNQLGNCLKEAMLVLGIQMPERM